MLASIRTRDFPSTSPLRRPVCRRCDMNGVNRDSSRTGPARLCETSPQACRRGRRGNLGWRSYSSVKSCAAKGPEAFLCLAITRDPNHAKIAHSSLDSDPRFCHRGIASPEQEKPALPESSAPRRRTERGEEVRF